MKGPTLNSTTGRKPSTTSTSSIQNHSATRPRQSEVYEDYSEAVENWRQRLVEKRKQSLRPHGDDDEPTTSSSVTKTIPSSPTEKSDDSETKAKPQRPSTTSTVSSVTPTNESMDKLTISNQIPPKSPSPQRIKGPAKIHEICIKKAVDVRGFGFKLEGGQTHNRPLYISTLEEGSPADKAGLCVDDEIISMHDENVEQMTFDQVRKLLKERNLRGSIRLVVRTFEEVVDDNSQTITAGQATEHSRTPSPQKLASNSQPITSAVSPSPTITRTIPVSVTIPSNAHPPIYTFVPYNPPPLCYPTPDSTLNTSMNMFGPKPFRSTASINLENQTSNESTTSSLEQQSSTVSDLSSQTTVISPPPNPVSISSESPTNNTSPSSTITAKAKAPPPPLTSVETLLRGTLDINKQDQQRNESFTGQARSSVEQHMNQLQEDFLFNQPHLRISHERRSVNIPVDSSNLVIPSSNQTQQSTNNHSSSSNGSTSRIYHNIESSTSQQFSPSYPKRSIQDIPSLFTNNATTTVAINRLPATDHPVNETKVNLSSPTSNQQPKKVSIQVDEKKTQQRITNKQLHTTFNQVPKKPLADDHSWINHDEQNKPNVLLPSTYQNGKSLLSNHRPAPPVPHHQDTQRNASSSKPISMFHYGDASDDLSYRPLRSAQHKHDFEPSIHRQHQLKNRPKSPIRTTINSNNNRVLSVSGKLHCSKCNQELGQGSAMVIESLGLYYHIDCFRCFVCNIPLSSSFEGTDVRVRSNRLHCQNCFSDENGDWRSNQALS
ncbi:unnamed protein product [Adineta ricciae]|uniref:Uncharacterized protein n=1 Tax=Adineta ricciae TaxID=249248 RepID=A0A814HWX9_ADIRI|nr:unnamed protein product [Adineta ricciae]